MTFNQATPRILFVVAAIFLAAISRILPHPFNFTPIAAMALFGGACLSNKRMAFGLPLAAMIVSDILLEIISGIGFHNTLIYVYFSFILITCLGIWISKNLSTSRVITASLTSSLLFFFITNAGVWLASGSPSGLAGLAATLLAGVPFYNNELFGSFFFNTIAGDLFYTGLLFGSLAFAQKQFPALARIK